MFFKAKEKALSKKYSIKELHKKYKHSEEELNKACAVGDLKKIKSSMKKHHLYEYALLYKQYSLNRSK